MSENVLLFGHCFHLVTLSNACPLQIRRVGNVQQPARKMGPCCYFISLLLSFVNFSLGYSRLLLKGRPGAKFIKNSDKFWKVLEAILRLS